MSRGSASEEQCLVLVLKHSNNTKNSFEKQTVILLKTVF